MARRSSGPLLSGVSLDRVSPVSLSQQLQDRLRDVILAGTLPQGSKLPSSRILAAELGVSRPTAVLALEGLEAEGFVETRRGAGTFVAASVPRHLPRPLPPRAPAAGTPGSPGPLSDMAVLLQGLSVDIEEHAPRPFLPNTPAIDRFPHALWQQCMSRQARAAYRGNLGYCDPAGFPGLRKAIAGYLALHRNDACDPDQIVITPGAHSGFMLAAMLLSNPGEAIAAEDPGPYLIRSMFAVLGRRMVHLPVDGDGMVIGTALAPDPGIRMVLAMPSRQHPLGRTLKLERRLQLLDWARTQGGWILEDDYDSEFRYTGRPLPSINSIDRSGRVIYAGTFSKALFPALRLGYLVLPPELVAPFRAATALMLRCVPLIPQMALAEFIAEGHFATHLRRMRDLYAQRRDQFLAAAQKAGAGLFHVERPDSGMNALLWLPEGLDDRQIAARAAAAGVHGYALSDYFLGAPGRPGLLLGFTDVAQHQFEPGLETVARILREAMA